MPKATYPQTAEPLLTGSGKPYDPEAVMRVLDSFLAGDATEQRETLDYLKRALDEQRIPESKLFP